MIPDDNQFTYIIEEYTNLPSEDFMGAPEQNFSVTLRININEILNLKQWLQKMFEFSKCTYRVTRSYKVAQKRVLFRMDMHCQHKQKCLTKEAERIKSNG